MTPNHRMIEKGYPFPDGVVGGSFPTVKSSLYLAEKNQIGKQEVKSPPTTRQAVNPTLHQVGSRANMLKSMSDCLMLAIHLFIWKNLACLQASQLASQLPCITPIEQIHYPLKSTHFIVTTVILKLYVEKIAKRLLIHPVPISLTRILQSARTQWLEPQKAQHCLKYTPSVSK